jgi:hypothetical protein
MPMSYTAMGESNLSVSIAFELGTLDESQYRDHIFERPVPMLRKTKKLTPPLHPGEMLREDFLILLGMTAQMLAHEIKVPERRVVAIVRDSAARLA